MSHRWNVRARNIQQIDSPLSSVGHFAPPFLPHWRHDEHVWRLAVDVEIILHILLEHTRRKRPESFSELDLQVDQSLHSRIARIGENASRTERTWTEFQ